MKRIALVAATLLGVGSLVPSIRDAGAQRRFYDSPRGLYTQQLIRRIDQLERRVERLERLVPGNGEMKPLDVETAEQRLAAAEDRLAHAEELYRKGYISQPQVEAERFESQRARMVLQFAATARDGDSTVQVKLEIELLDAEHDLTVAKGQLEVARRMSAEGLTDPTGLDAHRLAVEVAQKRFDEIQAKATRR